MDSCFDKSDSETVEYESVDEPVRLDTGNSWGTMMVGRWKCAPLRRGLPSRDPMLMLTFRNLRLRKGTVAGVWWGVQVKEIVCLGTNEVILYDEGRPLATSTDCARV